MPCLLAGIGNIIFYLLLLSLSEQIPFCAACLIAAAVTAMLTLYSRREPRSNSALAPSRRTM